MMATQNNANLEQEIDNQIKRIEQLEVEAQEAEGRSRDQQAQLEEAYRNVDEFRNINTSLQSTVDQMQSEKMKKEFQHEVEKKV